MARVASPLRGEIYLVSFDPTLGSEINKTRPALIIQNDVSNRHSPLTIVAAISSQFGEKLYPTEILVRAGEGGLQQDSVILLNQLRSIDRQRITKKIGKVSELTLRRMDLAIKISLGLVDI